jgi:hypothetical protein
VVRAWILLLIKKAQVSGSGEGLDPASDKKAQVSISGEGPDPASYNRPVQGNSPAF